MYNILIPALIILLNWTIPKYIQKYFILDKLSPFEITINNWIIGGFIGIILLFLVPYINSNFKIVNEKYLIYNFKNNLNYYHIFFGLLLIGILSSFCYYYLLNNSNVIKLTSYLNPISIILTLLISSYIFKEKINKGTLFGIFVIIIGLVIICIYE